MRVICVVELGAVGPLRWAVRHDLLGARPNWPAEGDDLEIPAFLHFDATADRAYESDSSVTVLVNPTEFDFSLGASAVRLHGVLLRHGDDCLFAYRQPELEFDPSGSDPVMVYRVSDSGLCFENNPDFSGIELDPIGHAVLSFRDVSGT